MRRLISERRVGGLRMERAVYAWAAGDALRDTDSDLTLKLVSGHHPVRARCTLGDGKQHTVGRLILTPPEADIAGVATDDEADMRSTVFHIDGELLERSLKSCGSAIRVADFPIDLDMHDTEIEASLLRLSAELERNGFGSEMVIDSLTRMLIVDLVRHVTQECDAVAAPAGGLRPVQLQHIYDYIASFDIGLPTPAEVANECGMSPTHLRRQFKRATGESLQDYIKDVRIGRAKAMLAEPDLPLKVVSYRLGFNHCSAFSFAFQQATGETPGQYRRRRENRLHEARVVDAHAFEGALAMARC